MGICVDNKSISALCRNQYNHATLLQICRQI